MPLCGRGGASAWDAMPFPGVGAWRRDRLVCRRRRRGASLCYLSAIARECGRWGLDDGTPAAPWKELSLTGEWDGRADF